MRAAILGLVFLNGVAALRVMDDEAMPTCKNSFSGNHDCSSSLPVLKRPQSDTPCAGGACSADECCENDKCSRYSQASICNDKIETLFMNSDEITCEGSCKADECCEHVDKCIKAKVQAENMGILGGGAMKNTISPDSCKEVEDCCPNLRCEAPLKLMRRGAACCAECWADDETIPITRGTFLSNEEVWLAEKNDRQDRIDRSMYDMTVDKPTWSSGIVSAIVDKETWEKQCVVKGEAATLCYRDQCGADQEFNLDDSAVTGDVDYLIANGCCRSCQDRCTCDNGDAARGRAEDGGNKCKKPGANQCQSCNRGFKLEGGDCKATCQHWVYVFSTKKAEDPRPEWVGRDNHCGKGKGWDKDKMEELVDSFAGARDSCCKDADF